MIKKLLSGEYMTHIESMTVEEREAYMKRVGEWLHDDGARLLAMTDRPMAKAQNVMSISVRWSATDCQAFQEGIRLLSALMGAADTWLPAVIYNKSAWRAVRHIATLLSEVKGESCAVKSPQTGMQTTQTEDQAKNSDNQSTNKDKPQTKAETKANTVQTIPSEKPQGAVTPARPKHIDQYVHLLPKSTQERAAMVRGLLREMDEAREKARLLMGDEHASADQRATWAKKAAKIDEQLGKIYKELDTEWEKLVNDGRVTVDELGQAHINEDSKIENEELEEKLGLTSEQKHRRRELRKWLIDLRRGKEGKARDERIGLWEKNWTEYLTLEPLESALKDEKIVAAAAHFGIEVNPDKHDKESKFS